MIGKLIGGEELTLAQSREGEVYTVISLDFDKKTVMKMEALGIMSKSIVKVNARGISKAAVISTQRGGKVALSEKYLKGISVVRHEADI